MARSLVWPGVCLIKVQIKTQCLPRAMRTVSERPVLPLSETCKCLLNLHTESTPMIMLAGLVLAVCHRKWTAILLEEALHQH